MDVATIDTKPPQKKFLAQPLVVVPLLGTSALTPTKGGSDGIVRGFANLCQTTSAAWYIGSSVVGKYLDVGIRMSANPTMGIIGANSSRKGKEEWVERINSPGRDRIQLASDR
jgi:hypothetical protein